MRWLTALLLAFALTGCGGASGPGSVGDVLTGLKAAGLPIGESQAFTAETDPNEQLGRPNGYSGKINFRDTRLEPRSADFDTRDGGSIEFFPPGGGAQRRKDYIQALGESLPTVAEYNYLNGNVLLRLSKRLTPAQAGEYEKALRTLK